jgi:hypothetical protein
MTQIMFHKGDLYETTTQGNPTVDSSEWDEMLFHELGNLNEMLEKLNNVLSYYERTRNPVKSEVEGAISAIEDLKEAILDVDICVPKFKIRDVIMEP